MRYVLDASVVLALLKREPGADRAAELLDAAIVSAVNLAEIVAGLARSDAWRPQVRAILDSLKLTVLPADEALAVEAGLMRAATDPFGLSLADRFCLATALRLGAPAATTDRAWRDVADAVGVEVELIR